MTLCILSKILVTQVLAIIRYSQINKTKRPTFLTPREFVTASLPSILTSVLFQMEAVVTTLQQATDVNVQTQTDSKTCVGMYLAMHSQTTIARKRCVLPIVLCLG